MRAPPESFRPTTGAPTCIARSMILQIFAALVSDSEPPNTVKSCAKTKTTPAVDPAVAGDHAVAGHHLLVHAEVGAAVRDQLVDLLERARVEQQLHALARRQLAGLVLAAQRAPRRRPVRRQPLEVLELRHRVAHSASLDAGVAERADALHLDHHAVAGHERTDAGRRAGRDDVAGLQRAEAREPLDQLGHREDQLAGVRVLALLAVHPALDVESDGSRPTAMHGPIGAKVSKPLAREYCTSLACSSRAVTSHRQVTPRT